MTHTIGTELSSDSLIFVSFNPGISDVLVCLCAVSEGVPRQLACVQLSPSVL